MTRNMSAVLLIEDDPADAQLIQEILRDEPESALELRHVDSLGRGLEALAAGGVDLVLLDLTLPDSTGFETFTRIQAQAPGTPVIVLTGMDDRDLAIRMVHEGAQDYLVKSLVNYTMLARSIRYSIERKQSLLEKDRLIEQLRDALAKVKTLTGLLPICAACKQIRNDQGYWQQVETYLQQHTSAVFTHSICPRCARRLYPNADKPAPG